MVIPCGFVAVFNPYLSLHRNIIPRTSRHPSPFPLAHPSLSAIGTLPAHSAFCVCLLPSQRIVQQVQTRFDIVRTAQLLLVVSHPLP